MIVLGVDPGTLVMGYGVIEARDDNVTMVDCGALTAKQRSPIGERLVYMYRGLMAVIARHSPDVVAVEQPFVAKNVRTALAIGRAQAVAILASAGSGLPVFEYTPALIKQRVSNFGGSGKEQVQEMVRLQLGLSAVPEPDDAADALAVALCHLQEMHINNLLAKAGR
jgi:crossover junction endodeoxyribonuclease RuvC